MLEAVDPFVTITGAGFVDSTALECRWHENGSAGLALVSTLPAKFISSTKIECTVTDQLFNQTSMPVVLQLSLDGGVTPQIMAGASAGLTMSFSLLRAP